MFKLLFDFGEMSPRVLIQCCRWDLALCDLADRNHEIQAIVLIVV
jgi:hypothetical protein